MFECKGGEILKEFDCVVIGQDIYSLTVALFLSRKMRKVLLVQDKSTFSDDFEKISIKVEDNSYSFKYNRDNIVTGLDENGLTYAYLDNLGLEKSIKSEKIFYEMVVDEAGNVRKRMNSLEQFRVYLVRYYPKHRKEIHNFFDDLHRHYKNFLDQYLNMLKNTDYTLSSLMIEWGDYSLLELLNKYFSSDELIKEFSLNDFINGLDLNEINSFSFFANFFSGLEAGFYEISNSIKEVREKLIEKIKLINPDTIVKGTIKKYVVNHKQEIEYLIDDSDQEIHAKYFFVSDNPIDFYSKNFENLEEDLEVIKSYYPNLNAKRKINTLYLVLKTKLVDIGINELLYYFKNNQDQELDLVRMYNYSLATNQDARRKEGLLCLDFSYDEDKKTTPAMVLKELDKRFPKIKKFLVETKLGKAKPYFSMLREEHLRKDLTINELIDIESLEHIQVFENLFLGGDFIRPEARFLGAINQGIVFGDKIEDRLYYGTDDDETFEYFSNDEIMMMIRHNYDYQYFGKKETHVNFHIGKSTYFVRCKAKNIVIHHGKYNGADLSIYTTNDKLTNLLLKKNTFSEVLDSGFLKYRGDVDLLFKAVKAFQLDDFEEYALEEYKTSKFKFLGVKFLFAHIFIYGIAAFLSNYFNNIFLFPAALALSLGISFIKYKFFEKINWFEYLLNAFLLVFAVLSIFVDSFNKLRSDDIFLAVITLTFLVSTFINQPIVFLYHQYDMNIDYRNTKLFKIITNGLTFIWGFIFLSILGGTYITGETYVSVLYSALFLGVFFTYYYPIIYVRTSIKKK